MIGSALGYTFSATSADLAVRAFVRTLFAEFDREDPPEVKQAFVLPGDKAGLDLAVAAMATTINIGAIVASAGALLLHAGAVARSDGGSAILCGPSGSGKSTLTATVVGRGLCYLTDETVHLDPLTLRITPYRKPISVKPGSHEVLQHLRASDGSPKAAWTSRATWHIPPRQLGGAVMPEAPLLPRWLVFPTYRSGAKLQLERLGNGEAAHLLGGNSSQLKALDRPLEALDRLVRRAPAYRLVHGDVQQAADAVERLVESA